MRSSLVVPGWTAPTKGDSPGTIKGRDRHYHSCRTGGLWIGWVRSCVQRRIPEVRPAGRAEVGRGVTTRCGESGSDHTVPEDRNRTGVMTYCCRPLDEIQKKSKGCGIRSSLCHRCCCWCRRGFAGFAGPVVLPSVVSVSPCRLAWISLSPHVSKSNSILRV